MQPSVLLPTKPVMWQPLPPAENSCFFRIQRLRPQPLLVQKNLFRLPLQMTEGFLRQQKVTSFWFLPLRKGAARIQLPFACSILFPAAPWSTLILWYLLKMFFSFVQIQARVLLITKTAATFIFWKQAFLIIPSTT